MSKLIGQKVQFVMENGQNNEGVVADKIGTALATGTDRDYIPYTMYVVVDNDNDVHSIDPQCITKVIG